MSENMYVECRMVVLLNLDNGEAFEKFLSRYINDPSNDVVNNLGNSESPEFYWASQWLEQLHDAAYWRDGKLYVQLSKTGKLITFDGEPFYLDFFDILHGYKDFETFLFELEKCVPDINYICRLMLDATQDEYEYYSWTFKYLNGKHSLQKKEFLEEDYYDDDESACMDEVWDRQMDSGRLESQLRNALKIAKDDLLF